MTSDRRSRIISPVHGATLTPRRLRLGGAPVRLGLRNFCKSRAAFAGVRELTVRKRPGEADMLEPPSRLLQTLRRLGPAPEGADAELLRRFVEHKDEPAFEELLRRHGDLVMRVCRRHLGSSADADDAFQAVFLVLARDAAGIARRESLAGWLFRVAFNVS